jgi:hypothetical protein
MKPNKLENQIKEKLNAREIKPSANSWDRLDAMLSVAEEKKTKKSLGWIYVAASILLFFGLGFFLFNADETPDITIQNHEVVNTNNVIDSAESTKTNQISVEKQQLVLVQNEVNYSKIVRNKKSEERKELIKEKNIIQEKPSPITYKYDSPENLLAEVQNEPKPNQTEKKISIKSKLKIDPNSLLTTVEKELDETYKETTLDKLAKKIQDAKSAIANRNYE